MAAVGLVVLVVAAGGLFLWGAGRFLVAENHLSQADAIVILGGEGTGFSRTRHGLVLFEAGYAPRVVFSGGQLTDIGLACSSAQISLDAARRLGLPAGAAVIAPEAQSTYDEAVNLQALVSQQGWRSIIVVTDPFHTRRAARTFRRLLPGVTLYMSAAPDQRVDAAHWWQTERGLVTVFNEGLKLGFYWARYGIVPF